MVEYYNLSSLGDSDNPLGIMGNVSTMTGQWFGIMLSMVVFLIPLIVMLKNNTEVNTAIHLSSFYALIFSILLYVSEIITYSIIIYIFALTWVITLVVRWYNK